MTLALTLLGWLVATLLVSLVAGLFVGAFIRAGSGDDNYSEEVLNEEEEHN